MDAKHHHPWPLSEKVFFILIVIVLILATLNVAKAQGWLLPSQPLINTPDNTVSLSSLTLEQKISQMTITSGRSDHVDAWKNLQVGGMHFFALQNEELYQNLISQYQQDQVIPFFITADLEGCLNPFSNFRAFPAASTLNTTEKARATGQSAGQFLTEMGFNLNFAPVVDLEDQIWRCRAFPGDETAITTLAAAYAAGLQSTGIKATAKHFPGETLIAKDPHKFIVHAKINSADIFPYQALKNNVSGIMVSHIIVTGALDSNGQPSVTSPLVKQLKENYSGLIISDEINMLGLKNFYPTIEELYIAVFLAGNDLILNFNEDPNEIYHMIQVIKEAVQSGKIPEEQIDASVKKILEAKGFKVEYSKERE